MIDTAQAGDIVLLLETDQRSLVGAAVDHRVDLAVMIPRHDHRRLTDRRRAVVAGFRNLDLEAKKVPGPPPEDLFLLQLVDFRIGKETVRGRARCLQQAN